MSKNIRTFATAVAVAAASALAGSRPRAAGRCREAVRHRAFRDLVQRDGAAALRPRDAIPAFVLVPAVQGDIRGDAQGRSRMRHCLLGHRAEPAVESACRRRPRTISPRALAAIEKGKASARRRQRERDYIDALAVMYADYDKVPHARARAGLSQGDGGVGGALSERRRSADLLRASRSTSRPRPTTRPMPTSSRGPPSWSRFSSASRAIPASRII